MKSIYVLFTTVLLPLAGCANLMTIDRSHELPGKGRVIHLDAPQRVVISDSEGVVCAEPSPDALQALASSFGAGLSVPTQGAVSLANALTSNTASIGLRTQSITLMRDALYRICEASHNKKLANTQVAQLLAQSQDLTLGVLAIEQLTGAIIARQPILTSGANADASSNVANTKAALESATKNEQLAKEALAAAQKKEKDESDLVSKLQADFDTKNSANPKDPAAISKADELLQAEKANLSKASDETKSAQTSYDDAHKAKLAIEQNFNTAIASAHATANGSGSFAAGFDHKTIDKDTVEKIAGATKEIVNMVLTKGHVTDTCMNLMMTFAGDPKKQSALSIVNDQCKEVLKVYLEMYIEQIKKGLPAPPTPRPNQVPPAGVGGSNATQPPTVPTELSPKPVTKIR